MLSEIWEPDLSVVFVGSVVPELSDKLGFYYLHPTDRFWESLELAAITPKRIITPQERKALTDGQKAGNLSDPIRAMFIEKKTSLLLKLGIGITHLNRRVLADNEKDKLARPTDDDVSQFISRAGELSPRILAIVTIPELFVELFKSHLHGVSPVLGLQPETIGTSEVWLLGSTIAQLRGEALTRQEDAFFALGQRVEAIRGAVAK